MPRRHAFFRIAFGGVAALLCAHFAAAPETTVPSFELDPDGNFVGSWGGLGQGYEWPDSNHGITVDHKGNVWLGGNGDNDTQILKFTKEGKFLLQIGKHGQHHGSNDTANLWRAAKMFADPDAIEIYVGDGHGVRDLGVWKRLLPRQDGRDRSGWGERGRASLRDAAHVGGMGRRGAAAHRRSRRGTLSIALWVAVMLAGRMMSYTMFSAAPTP